MHQQQGVSPFLTFNELWEANERKVGVNRLREWGRAGHLKTVRLGRKVLVPRTELERLVEIAEKAE